MNDPSMMPEKADILVVDDIPENLRLLAGILADRGYRIRPARDGFQALSIAQNIPIDLILLDIMMPGISGYEVCQKLKADEVTRDIPVIFISAINEVLDKVKAFAVGGVDYITKPFQAEEVLARVETQCQMRFLQKHLKQNNETLQQKNEELTTILKQLRATQEELIQSEKMATLGQLVASIAHEVNTPLGAIRSSVGNMSKYLAETFAELPTMIRTFSPAELEIFFALVERSIHKNPTVSLKESRKLKRELIRKMEDEQISNPDVIADTLIDMEIYQDIVPFFPLLKRSDSRNVLEIAYNLSGLQRSTQIIYTATERATKVVFALKTYAHYDETGKRIKASIIQGIDTVLTLYQNSLKQGVTVIRNYIDLPHFYCYPDELNQVWTNIVHNAIQAMDNRGTLTIDVTQVEEQAKVSITDSGSGILPEIIPRIFEPFFTTKAPGEGSGLGLDIVKKIVEKHQGTIEAESVPGKTTFTVFLPMNLQS
ncbi:response regulator [Kamptonema animale CS-326]|jgi:two-component system NtrC family sensor kinase|uniref:sensor histidine kinase n=1 Tax=Kamptonema animale TaxID=92934 RepID=UPI0023306DDD|nr:response regulator [Kamptonema animale]MDB9512821.1 response regulator [Kamptonema animale CS-326]